MPRDMLPIIHPGPLQGAVVELETERFDEMQNGIGGGAEPGERAGVRRNFGFDEDDV